MCNGEVHSVSYKKLESSYRCNVNNDCANGECCGEIAFSATAYGNQAKVYNKNAVPPKYYCNVKWLRTFTIDASEGKHYYSFKCNEDGAVNTAVGVVAAALLVAATQL